MKLPRTVIPSALVLVALLKTTYAVAALPTNPASVVDEFHPPAPSAGPWVFWMWLRVETTQQAITADLESMYAEGIRGAILYGSGVGGAMEATSRMELQGKNYVKVPTEDFAGAHLTTLPYPQMPSWQPHSRQLVRWAAHEASRLGIRLVITVGLASTSGEIDLRDGQQMLEWSELSVQGGSSIDQALPPPDHIVKQSRVAVRSMVAETLKTSAHAEYRRQIAVLAVPDREGFSIEEVVDLTLTTDASEHLLWDAPTGRWRVLRFAYEPAGMSNAWGCTPMR